MIRHVREGYGHCEHAADVTCTVCTPGPLERPVDMMHEETASYLDNDAGPVTRIEATEGGLTVTFQRMRLFVPVYRAEWRGSPPKGVPSVLGDA